MQSTFENTSPASEVKIEAGPQGKNSISRRLPSLDGWRAISIILVLGAHCPRVPNFPTSLTSFFTIFDGDFGVRCFFVISGFLITWLLLQEHDSKGRVDLRHFYIRRALRILPVYFAFMATLFFLHLFTPFNQDRGTWIANVTFTTNFYTTTWTSGHLWSLSVEEQFYLIWPVLFVSFAVAQKPGAAFKILAVPLVLAPLWRVVTYKEFYPPSLKLLFAHFSFFNYFDCLAIGCLCAVGLKHYRELIEKWLVNYPKELLLVGLFFILLPYLLMRFHLPGRLFAASTASLQAFGFALLLLLSVMPANGRLFSPLNWKWVRHIGVLSYSIYIWQMIFCTKPETFGLTHVWWMAFPGWLVPVLVVAHLSYYLFERPLFRLRSHFR